MQVPAMTFPDNETAVIQLPNCRMATQVRDFFYSRGIHMKTQCADGRLTLRVPLAPFHIKGNTENKSRMTTLFEEFCRINGLQIAQIAS